MAKQPSKSNTSAKTYTSRPLKGEIFKNDPKANRRGGTQANPGTEYSGTPSTGFGGYTKGEFAGYTGPRVGGKAPKSTGMASGTAPKSLVKSTKKASLKRSAASPQAKAAQRRAK